MAPALGPTAVELFYPLTGFSGHGFMHGPTCGLLMAEILLDGHAHRLDVSARCPGRFAAGGGLREHNVVSLGPHDTSSPGRRRCQSVACS